MELLRRIPRTPFEQLTPVTTSTLSPLNKPVATVKPGEEFEVETWDASGGVVKPGQLRAQAVERGIKIPVNPITGPLYVEGAEPGDALHMHILGIELPERGWTSIGVGVSPLGIHVDQPKTKYLEILGGRVHYVTEKGRNILIDADPFIGTIGVSPAYESISTMTPGSHGGNMDCPDIRPGNTLILPVRQQGALLGLGDVHAVQGDGEVSGVAAEIPAVVKLRVDLKKAAGINWPRVESSTEIMTVCSAKPLEDAMRLAHRELIDWMVRDYGWTQVDAHMFLSLTAKTRVAQIVDPLWTVVAKLSKSHLGV